VSLTKVLHSLNYTKKKEDSGYAAYPRPNGRGFAKVVWHIKNRRIILLFFCLLNG